MGAAGLLRLLFARITAIHVVMHTGLGQMLSDEVFFEKKTLSVRTHKTMSKATLSNEEPAVISENEEYCLAQEFILGIYCAAA